MIRNAVLAFGLCAGLGGQAQGPPPLRTVEGQAVTSTALPRVRIEVKRPFRYLGRMPFTIRDVAAGERIVFGDLEGNVVRRMVALQFEGFLPHITDIYRYDFSAATQVGPLRWRRNAFAYSTSGTRSADPSSEAATMHAWLANRGYSMPDTQLMFRYLTLGDDRRRDELIVFYLEGTADPSWLEEMEVSSVRWRAMARALEQRSRSSFEVHSVP